MTATTASWAGIMTASWPEAPSPRKLRPVGGFGGIAVGNHAGCREAHVVLGDELDAAGSLAVVEPDLGRGRDFADGEVEAPAADLRALGVAVPHDVVRDAYGAQEARAQIVEDSLSRRLAEDGGDEIGGAGVVGEVGAGLEGEVVLEDVRGPGAVVVEVAAVAQAVVAFAEEAALPVAARHGKQIAHRDAAHALTDFVRDILGEEVDELVVERDEPFAARDAEGRGGEALGEGEKLVAVGRPARGAVFLHERAPALADDEAVRVFEGEEFVDEGGEGHGDGFRVR